jgi:hypothetical protein
LKHNIDRAVKAEAELSTFRQQIAERERRAVEFGHARGMWLLEDVLAGYRVACQLQQTQQPKDGAEK